MTLFLVGRINKQKKHRREMLGLFFSEREAKSHCISWYDFYGPVRLNAHLESTPGRWLGLHYPIAEDYYREHPEEVPDEAKERYAELVAE